ncbi:MAG TPA: ATP-grasp domain-containing protein [Myxococcales bacterium]
MSAPTGRRLRFLVARRPDGPSEIVTRTSAILEARGFDVSSVIAEEVVQRPERMGAEADLFLLKSYTPLSLSLAAVLERAGARVLNPHRACLAARDKIIAAQVLSAAGIPAPRCWVTGDLSLLAPLAEETALVVKPHMGWRGEGVRIVRGAAELLALPPAREPLLVQEFLPGTGVDLRVYVAGSRVFATRKPFSSSSFSVPGEPAAVSEEVRDIALRCGAAFGLGLYGLDLIETPRGPFVVDVNYFPGYKGLSDAAEAVADHVTLYAGAEDVPGAVVSPPHSAGPSWVGAAR